MVEGEDAALETDGSRLEVDGAAAFSWWGRSDCTLDDLGVGMMGGLFERKARRGFWQTFQAPP